MMLEPALSARVLGDEQLAMEVSPRVDWMRRPSGVLPALTLQVISDPRPQTMGAFQSVRQTRVQVDVWAVTAKAAALLRQRVIAAFAPSALAEGVRFQRAQVTNVRSGFEQLEAGSASNPRGELYRETIDFIFTHNAS